MLGHHISETTSLLPSRGTFTTWFIQRQTTHCSDKKSATWPPITKVYSGVLSFQDSGSRASGQKSHHSPLSLLPYLFPLQPQPFVTCS